ncbi:MAG: CopG family transcriptional regulator [Clostridiales bacterium]|nr:CopG family transcriptional regulator [Clostridiales bacterium]
MEYQNITLSIQKDLLKKVKHIAIEKNTSVSGLLSQTLVDIVNQETGYQRAKERQLKVMESGLELGLSGKTTWSREELHER